MMESQIIEARNMLTDVLLTLDYRSEQTQLGKPKPFSVCSSPNGVNR